MFFQGEMIVHTEKVELWNDWYEELFAAVSTKTLPWYLLKPNHLGYQFCLFWEWKIRSKSHNFLPN